MKREGLLKPIAVALIGSLTLGVSVLAHAAEPAGSQSVLAQLAGNAATTQSVRMATTLTLLSFLPAVILSMTAFLRIVIVLSMVRHAMGMPETPPTPVLLILGLLLTAFVMAPAFNTINVQALEPYLAGRLSFDAALQEGAAPLRDFMLRQVRENELAFMYQLAGKPLPTDQTQVGMLELTSAFILNELRVAFQIGFVILLPFLLIDLIVSSVLLSLGMMMMPPTTISLPLKVLMFVLIDGWSLVLQGVLGSFR